MKHLLLAISLVFIQLTASAGTISGTVYYKSGPTTCNMQTVFIWDTLHTWFATVYTDYDGRYEAQVPASIPATGAGSYLNVRLTTCEFQQKAATNSGTAVVDFNVCASRPPISGLFGRIFRGDPASVTVVNKAQARLYLVRKDYDPAANDTVLTAIDSFLSDTDGSTYYRAYSVKPHGRLFIRGSLLPGDPDFLNYLPAYAKHGAGDLTPLTSLAFVANEFTADASSHPVYLNQALQPSGPGRISGRIVMGAGKTSGTGDPLPGRVLYLVDKTTGRLAAVMSDANGTFSFPSVAYGNFELFGDQFGKSNPHLQLSLSAMGPGADSIVFEETSHRFGPATGTLGAKAGRLSAIRAYPNPAGDVVRISGLQSFSGRKTISLQSMTGAEISRYSLFAGNATIETASLPAGVYMIHVQTEQGNVVLKITK